MRSTFLLVALCAFFAVGIARAPAWPFHMARYQQTLEKDFDATGVTTLEVHVPSGDLELRPGLSRPQAASPAGAPAVHANSVHVSGLLRGSSQDALAGVTVTSQRDGNRLVLTVNEPRWHGLSSEKFTIGFPPSAALRVFDSSGDVRIDDPRGSVMVSESSGDVIVGSPQGSVEVSSSSGDIVVREARSSLTLSSSSGDLVATLASGWSGSALALSSSSGDVKLTLPAAFRGHLDASIGSGDFRNGTNLPRGGNDGIAVRLHAASGDITVTQ
ncbi:MAG TPA: DUF4097 family beta strand repeat-containing protein [Candidatus Baltobacteraceae bacterium]